MMGIAMRIILLISVSLTIQLTTAWTLPEVKTIPSRIKRQAYKCKPLKKSHTYTLECKLNGQVVDCENAQEGTTATAQCANFYTANKNDIRYTEDILCSGGSWNNDPGICTPVCGRKHIQAETLIIGGRTEKIEYPWIVAIYNSANDYICEGSIIHDRYVLSAAHCFTTDSGEILNSNGYTIAAGTIYRKFNDSRDSYKQIVKVQGIYTPDYRGQVRQFANDIALLKLQTRLRFSEYVQPVCLDQYSSDNDLVDNATAVILGWGSPPDTRKKLIVPFRTRDACTKELPEEFDRYYTNDKICAGYIGNGTNICIGDGGASGGGLYMRSADGLFYVRGILSLSPSTGTSSTERCGGSVTFALYTKVSSHTRWIANTIRTTINKSTTT